MVRLKLRECDEDKVFTVQSRRIGNYIIQQMDAKRAATMQQPRRDRRDPSASYVSTEQQQGGLLFRFLEDSQSASTTSKAKCVPVTSFELRRARAEYNEADTKGDLRSPVVFDV